MDPGAARFSNIYNAVDTNTYRAKRKYKLVQSDNTSCFSTMPQYVGKDFCLRYDREASTDYTTNANSEMLRGITMFKVFRDDVASPNASRASFSGIPAELPKYRAGGFNADGRTNLATFTTGTGDISVMDSDQVLDEVPGYTILLEVAVDSSYKYGSFIDAKGNDVRLTENPPRKRVTRYIQVHPLSAVP